MVQFTSQLDNFDKLPNALRKQMELHNTENNEKILDAGGVVGF